MKREEHVRATRSALVREILLIISFTRIFSFVFFVSSWLKILEPGNLSLAA